MQVAGENSSIEERKSLLNSEKPGINTSFGRHPRFADNKTGELPLLMKKTMSLGMGFVGQILNGGNLHTEPQQVEVKMKFKR